MLTFSPDSYFHDLRDVPIGLLLCSKSTITLEVTQTNDLRLPAGLPLRYGYPIPLGGEREPSSGNNRNSKLRSRLLPYHGHSQICDKICITCTAQATYITELPLGPSDVDYNIPCRKASWVGEVSVSASYR